MTSFSVGPGCLLAFAVLEHTEAILPCFDVYQSGLNIFYWDESVGKPRLLTIEFPFNCSLKYGVLSRDPEISPNQLLFYIVPELDPP